MEAFRRNSFLSNVVKLAGGSALGQALVMLSMPIVTRLFGPGDMGIFGIFMSFVAFASVAVSLRYDLAIVAARDCYEANVLLILAMALAIPCVSVSILVLFLMVHFRLLGFGALPLWSLLAMAIVLLFTGVFSALRFWHVGRKKFGEISLALVCQGGGRAVVPVILGLMPIGWIGLLWGEILGRTAGVGRLLRGALPEMRGTLEALDRATLLMVWRRYWKYPAVFLPSSMVDALATSLPLPIISSLYGVEAAGQYFLVYRLASVPATLISAGVADVFHQRITDASRHDKAAVRPIIFSAMRKLTAVSFSIYLPVALLSPFVFTVVFGTSWQQAGILMSIQGLASVSGLVVSPLSRALAVSNHPELKLLPDVTRLVLPLGSLWAASSLGASFIFSMVIFSVLTVLSEVVYLCTIWYATAEHRQVVSH